MTKWLNKNKSLLFGIGLGGIFLANSVTAWVSPDEFKELIAGNSILSHVGHADLLVKLVGVNDALLFVFLAYGKCRKQVALWGSVWIAAVIYVTGFWTPDFIEHIGVLALLAYYATLSTKK